jgi:SAF domain
MTTTASTRTASLGPVAKGRTASGPPPEQGGAWGSAPAGRRGSRRRWTLAAVGVLLSAGSAVVGLVVWSDAGAARELLVAARSIPAGHVVTESDVRVVAVGGAEGVSVVPAEQASSVVGRAASVPVAAGALLPAEVVGDAGVLPPPGSAVVSKAVGPGVLSPLAGPGATVRVYPAPADGTPGVGARSGSGWDAVVLGVDPGVSGEQSVVSLQVADQDAAAVVAAGSRIAIVVVSAGR